MDSRHRRLLAFNGWIVIVLFACFLSASANFCGEENALPYQLNISADGELQLSCIKLSCAFGMQDVVSNGSTNNITASERNDTKQTTSNNGSMCRSEPWSSSCAADGQGWFGGSASFSAAKKCCHNDKIKAYKQHSQRLLHHGDNFLGGAVIENKRQVAFDFISDARKLNDGQNRSKYLVVMSRMVCLPKPSHPTNEVESGLEEKLIKEIKKLNKDGAANAKAHGVETEALGDEYVEESDPNGGTESPSENEPSGQPGASKLQPPPVGNNGSTPAPNYDDYESDTPEPPYKEKDPSPFQDQATDANCFTSPSGHRCCSRQVEALLKELPNAINNQLDENANTSVVQRKMLDFLTAETDERDRFKQTCGKFEHIISKGEFAAKTHMLGGDSGALGCKMQVRIGGNRYRRQADGSDPFVFTVLTYAVALDPSAQTFDIVFRDAPEPPPQQLIQQFFPQPLIPAAWPAPLPFAPQVAPAIAPQVAPAVAPQVAPAIAPQVANVFVQPVAQAAPAVAVAGAGGGGACFSGDTVVKTDKGIKRMDELVIGDIVLSADKQIPAFSPVITFLHRVPDRKMTFYKIDTASGDSTMSIKLTGNHFIYVTDCTTLKYRRIYASEVELGHCLLVLDEKGGVFVPTPVVNVSKIWQTGIYSPLTSTGTIVVNNLLASCHSSVTGKHALHQTFLYWLETVNSWIARAAMFFNVKLSDEEVFELSKGVEFVLSTLEMILPSLSAYS